MIEIRLQQLRNTFLPMYIDNTGPSALRRESIEKKKLRTGKDSMRQLFHHASYIDPFFPDANPMVKLPTQPRRANAQLTSKKSLKTTNGKKRGAGIVAVRSGFYGLQTASGSWIFARRHKQHEADTGISETPPESSESRLFVTGLPWGTTKLGLSNSFGQLYPAVRVVEVQILPTLESSRPGTTLISHEVTAAEHNSELTALFASTSATTLDDENLTSASALSAILTFTAPIAFPPVSLPLDFLPAPTSSSFLNNCLKRYNTARPHLSVVIAHTDSWLALYDRRKLTAATVYNTTWIDEGISSSAPTQKKRKTKHKSLESGPLPGSAAYALARHQATLAKERDPSYNPDEIQEGEWTLVSRGGKHGKSLVSNGAVSSLTGYGDQTVKVARAGKRGRVDEDEMKPDGEPGVKRIVGDGFYRFKKEETRRTELSNLKAKFEHDKIRLGRYQKVRSKS